MIIYLCRWWITEVTSINLPVRAFALANVQCIKHIKKYDALVNKSVHIFYPGMCKCKRECFLTILPLSEEATPRIDFNIK